MDEYDGEFEKPLFEVDLSTIEALTRETRDNRPGLNALQDTVCAQTISVCKGVTVNPPRYVNPHPSTQRASPSSFSQRDSQLTVQISAQDREAEGERRGRPAGQDGGGRRGQRAAREAEEEGQEEEVGQEQGGPLDQTEAGETAGERLGGSNVPPPPSSVLISSEPRQ